MLLGGVTAVTRRSSKPPPELRIVLAVVYLICELLKSALSGLSHHPPPTEINILQSFSPENTISI